MIVDFYELLGIPPGSDRAAIEIALSQRQPEWSALIGRGDDSTRYARYLDQIPALRQALLSTPQARAEYDASLAAVRAAARHRSLDDLQRIVRLRAAKGGLTVSDRQFVRDEAFRLGLAKESADRLLEPFPPLPEAPRDPDDEPPADVINFESTREIRAVLDALRRRDLYDLLDLAQDAPLSEIAHRATEIRNQNTKRGTIEDAATWLTAMRLVQTHLTTPDARARYDRSVTADSIDRFSQVVTATVRGQPRLDAATHRALLEEGNALGLDTGRAQRAVRRVCRFEGVILDAAAPSLPPAAATRWLRCRACGGLTDFARADVAAAGQCKHCRNTLRWECPICKAGAWVDEPTCRCGFALEHLEPMVRHFAAAQRAFRLRHLGEAMSHLRLVQTYAPRHVGARNGLEKLQNQIGSIRKLRSDFARERAAGNLVAARAVLDRWGRLVAPTDARWKTSLYAVSARLGEAEALTARGNRLSTTDAGEARACYRKALAIAADLPEALDGLRRCPPNGPTNLVAETQHARVALRWSPPEPDGLGPVSFLVLRRRAAAPAHTDDGVVVARLNECEWVDTRVEPGDLFGYAVCAVRNESVSLYGVSTGPVVATSDVSNARADGTSGTITLTWSLPVNAIGARVVRKVGTAIEHPRDGVAIECSRDTAVDGNLEDGRSYHYRIYALYQGADGKPVASRGVALSAIPGEAPRAIDDLRLEPQLDGRLWLRWTPIDHGKVRIVRGAVPLAWREGERPHVAEIEQTGAHWLEPVTDGSAVESLSDGPPLAYYTPLSIAMGVATVGRHATWARLDDPINLRASRLPGSADHLRLRWSWANLPAEAGALVVARQGRFPLGPEDADAHCIYVDKTTYWRDAALDVTLPHASAGDWHLVVYACIEHDGERWCSPGVEPTARLVVPDAAATPIVYYRVSAPRIASAPWSIRFETDPPGVAIGPTVLVARPRVAPLNTHDGPIVARFPDTQDGVALSFRPSSRLAGRKLRLFPDPAQMRSGPENVRVLCLPRGADVPRPSVEKSTTNA